MEAEIVRFTKEIFHADSEVTGLTTSGGTDSISNAVLAYKLQAKERGVTRPNLVVVHSAHLAFERACRYYDIEFRMVPMRNWCADLEAIEKAVDSNTIALVGSFCEYSYGITDPIQDMASVAERKGIGMHVDCCLGGYFFPFVEEADSSSELPLFDF